MNKISLTTRSSLFRNFKVPVVALIATLPFVLASNSQAQLPSDVADAFGLNGGALVNLDLDTTPGAYVESDITIEGEEYSLNLFPHSIRTEKFVLKEQIENGSFRIVEPSPTRTVKGMLVGSKGSRVVGSILDNGLSAKIVLGDGDVLFIEPVSSKLENTNQPGQHVLYRSYDVRPIDGTCSVGEAQQHHFENVRRNQDIQRRFHSHNNDPIVKFGSIPNIAVCEVGVDADFEYFSDWNTTQATMDRMELVLNIVNDQYQTETAIVHQISGAVIRTTSNDPYTTSNPNALLNQFQNEWLANQQGIQRDVAHLFTGRELDGTTIGIAALGTICTNAGFGLVQSDIGALVCVTDLSAHELGHNWNANHCNCNTFTMNASLTCANTFTTASENSIINHKNTRNCLSFLAPDNDDFADRFSVGSLPATISANNLGATSEGNEQDLDGTGGTVWWSFVAPGTGVARIRLEGSDFDTKLHIYTGAENGLANLQPVAYNDDDESNTYSDVIFPVTAFQNYEIRVGGFQGTGVPATGDIEMEVTFMAQGLVDLFWSDKGPGEGAFNFSNAQADFGSGGSGSIYLYYDPSNSDIDTGAFVDVTTSDSGVIEFTSAESLEFDITVAGNPFSLRWGDGVGPANDVTADFVDNMGALTIVQGEGMLAQNTGPTFFDEGYDAAAGAFAFARVDFNVIGPVGSSVDIITNRGLGRIVHNNMALDPTKGVFTINVVEEKTVLLGDVNCDGVVNLLDVQPFVDLLSNGGFSPKADFNDDGVVNLLDVAGFVDTLAGN